MIYQALLKITCFLSQQVYFLYQLFILEGSSRTSLLQLATFFFFRFIGGQLIPLLCVPALYCGLPVISLCSGLVGRVLSGFCMVRNEESGQSAIICTKSHMKGFLIFWAIFQILHSLCLFCIFFLLCKPD